MEPNLIAKAAHNDERLKKYFGDLETMMNRLSL